MCDIVLSNSYTMGTHGLPDIYTQSLRAEGVYIRQTTIAHGIYHFWCTQLCSRWKQIWPQLVSYIC